MNTENLYFFDMEYVPGLSYYDFFSSASVENINFVVETLFSYFDFISSRFRMIDMRNEVLNKLDSLKISSYYFDYIEYIKGVVADGPLMIPNTFCHGDLSFSNILFHPNRLFFIDFLDCYVDSFLSDLVKLKQDLYYLWNLKVNNSYSIRMVQIYKNIWKRIEERYEYYIHTKSFDVLDAVNVLRIEPYLTNSQQTTILDKVITSTKLYVEFDSSYGREIF